MVFWIPWRLEFPTGNLPVPRERCRQLPAYPDPSGLDQGGRQGLLDPPPGKRETLGKPWENPFRISESGHRYNRHAYGNAYGNACGKYISFMISSRYPYDTLW